jgi:hypothetical protein
MITFIILSLLAVAIGGVSTYFLITKSFIPGKAFARIAIGISLGILWSVLIYAIIAKSVALAH